MEREVDLGTNLYDMNKKLVENFDQALPKKALKRLIKKTVHPFFQKQIEKYKYFMLLCHEERDYTVFNLLNPQEKEYNYITITSELIECLQNRGEIYSIEKTLAQDALEIWIRSSVDSQIYCYYLFPYDSGIIEIQKET